MPENKEKTTFKKFCFEDILTKLFIMSTLETIAKKDLAEVFYCLFRLYKRQGTFILTLVSALVKIKFNIGASPSGKAAGFGPAIQRFESFRPSYFFCL